MLLFVELDGFTDNWNALALTDADLHRLQKSLIARPLQGPVVSGTGGLRKTRFAPPRWQKGKSGSARICYVYFELYAVVLLVAAYSKNQKADISPTEKAGIKRVILRIEKTLAEKAGISPEETS